MRRTWTDEEPDDITLIERGVMADAPDGPAADRVMVLACGAIAREVALFASAAGLDHVDIEALPARLHARSDAIPAALRARARVAFARGYGRVAAVFGDCGTGGAIAALCREEGIAHAALPTCAAFLDRADAGGDGLLLTDFLVRHFDRLFWRAMRLDLSPELIDVLFAHHDRIVHLAQREDAALDAYAIRVAVLLNLPIERRDAPVTDLARHLGPLLENPG